MTDSSENVTLSALVAPDLAASSKSFCKHGPVVSFATRWKFSLMSRSFGYNLVVAEICASPFEKSSEAACCIPGESSKIEVDTFKHVSRLFLSAGGRSSAAVCGAEVYPGRSACNSSARFASARSATASALFALPQAANASAGTNRRIEPVRASVMARP